MSGSDEREERVPERLWPSIVLGLLIAIVGVGGFATWAATAQLSGAVVAVGTVKVVSSRKKVQSLGGGVVKELRVRNGDRVKRGQVLLRLDNTRTNAALSVAQSNYDLTRAIVARLRAERDKADEIVFPKDFQTRADQEAIKEITHGQTQLFKARREELTGQENMMGERVGQLDEEIIGLRAQSRSKKKQLTLIQDELKDLTGLYDKGLTQRSRLLNLEREKARLEGEKGEHDAGIARAGRLISESKLAALQLRTTFHKSVRDELSTREGEMYTMAERYAAALHELEKMELRATDDGVVVGLNIHTVGGVVEPAKTLMEIVPVQDKLVIEARIMPTDIDNIQIGQTAELVFSSLPRDQVPRMVGQINYVSADALDDVGTQTSFYAVRVSLSEEEKKKLQHYELVPGMPVEIYAQTGERTPLAYLLEPIRKNLDKAWREP